MRKDSGRGSDRGRAVTKTAKGYHQLIVERHTSSPVGRLPVGIPALENTQVLPKSNKICASRFKNKKRFGYCDFRQACQRGCLET